MEDKPRYAGKVEPPAPALRADGPIVENPLTIADIARICHEVNRCYCEVNKDQSQLLWDLSPQWQKDSAVAGVRFALLNPDATPEKLHDSWMAKKTLDGWKYGPTKDAEEKEHPCMIPYAELPEAQKVKDVLFSAVVTALRPFVVWP